MTYNIYSHSHGTGCTTVSILLAAMGNARLTVKGTNYDDVYVYSGRQQDPYSIYDFGWAQDFTERQMRDRGVYGMYEADSLDTNVLVVDNTYLGLKRAVSGEEQRATMRRSPEFVVCVIDDGRALNLRSVEDVVGGAVGEHAVFVPLYRSADIARQTDAGLLGHPDRIPQQARHGLKRIVDAMLSQPRM